MLERVVARNLKNEDGPKYHKIQESKVYGPLV
jgi:hypothetical protein